jgi:hypothetical protein
LKSDPLETGAARLDGCCRNRSYKAEMSVFTEGSLILAARGFDDRQVREDI